MGELSIQHEESGHKGAFFVDAGGKRVAVMTYTRSNPGMVIIDHTEVDDSLKGQGVGRKLLDAFVAWARESKTSIVPICPYAKAQFEKDPSIRDVLSPRSPPLGLSHS